MMSDYDLEVKEEKEREFDDSEYFTAKEKLGITNESSMESVFEARLYNNDN